MVLVELPSDEITPSFEKLFIQETQRRLFDESYSRLKKCLDLLSEEEVWLRPNSQTSSIGNLILHLCGNARQWIWCTLGRFSDTRIRDEEFSDSVSVPKAELIQILDQLEKDLRLVLAQITPNALLQTYSVQCYQETGVSILVHVIEHFSYHVGQISYAVKTRKDVHLGYYQGQNLNQKA